MNRAGKLLLLTHGYPLFMVCHMQWGNSSLFSNILFQVIPVLFIFLLIGEWKMTSNKKLVWHERQYLNYFIFCFVILHFYYIACFFEGKEWIERHNQYFFWYGVITTLFYTYIHVKRKINR